MEATNLLNRAKGINHNILVLPSWYPSRLDPFAGDFIKRHVEAISDFHAQDVIFLVKDEHGVLTKDILETRNEFKNFTEVIIYYHIRKTGISIVDKFRSDIKYLQLYKNYLKKYLRKKGVPILCHVHVSMKAGLAALWLKKKYNLPYLVTEHWSGYLDEAVPRLCDHSLIFQKRTQIILAEAMVVTAVSSYLANGIHNIFPELRIVTIANVVDTRIFYPSEKNRGDTTKFIHASTMDYAKNLEKIFKALQVIKSRYYDFRMELYGPVQRSISDLINSMALQDYVILKGDVSQETLAEAMRNADAYIQFSRFETFSCVVIEANAAGLPVFVSDIPSLRELVTDNKNGYHVNADDSQALAAKLMAFIDGKLPRSKQLISAYTEKFSYQAIGKSFSNVYSDIIKHA